MHELAFCSPFPMEGYLVQSRYSGDGLGPALSYVSDFVDSPREISPSLRNRWGWGEGGVVGGLGLVC